MGQGAGRRRVCLFQIPSICEYARGRTKIIWPKGEPWAGIFPSESLDLRVRWGTNKNQWAEGWAAGGYIFLKAPRIAGVVEEEQNQWAEGRVAGWYIISSEVVTEASGFVGRPRSAETVFAIAVNA